MSSQTLNTKLRFGAVYLYCACATVLSLAAIADAPTTPPAPLGARGTPGIADAKEGASEAQEKFAVLGFIARQAAGSAFSSLMRWAAARYLASSGPARTAATGTEVRGSIAPEASAPLPMSVAVSRGVPISFAAASRERGQSAWVETPSSLIDPPSQFPPTTLLASSTRAIYADTPIIRGTPDVPIQAMKSAAPSQWAVANYAGLQVNLLVVDEKGSVNSSHPLDRTLKSGDRFRLQLTSTFDALVAVDAVQTRFTKDEFMRATPVQGRIYPQALDRVVKLPANEVVSIPLGQNEYFVFDESIGVDTLLLHVRHPASSGLQSRAQPWYREDSPAGSLFLQLSVPNESPALSQPISLRTRMPVASN